MAERTLWQRGDHWEFDSSVFEQARYARLLALLAGRRYAHVLELGCGSGSFTQQLAGLADHVVALDISPTAIARARAQWTGPATVDFRQANIMDYDLHAEGPWDLVVIIDTMCYLGWLYSFFDVSWFASQIFAATRAGGHCLFANTMGEFGDMLLLPWLTRTYQSLLRNVGYRLEVEEVFCGTKYGVTIEVLMSLLSKNSELGSNGAS
jgi:2-polyprenyl-3-methyl-5-hydroxy-6-metoxy-1,4-benzoquinol methylase